MSSYNNGVHYCTADTERANLNSNGWTITDSGQNCTPTGITLSGSGSIPENTTSIGSFSTVDYDGGTHSYSLAVGTGSEDNSLFSLTSSGVLSFSSAPDFEDPTDTGSTVGNNTYSLRVRTTDSTSNTFEKVFVITVTDVDDENPVISLGGSTPMDIEIGNTFTDL